MQKRQKTQWSTLKNCTFLAQESYPVAAAIALGQSSFPYMAAGYNISFGFSSLGKFLLVPSKFTLLLPSDKT